jgi:hypothetical protein
MRNGERRMKFPVLADQRVEIDGALQHSHTQDSAHRTVETVETQQVLLVPGDERSIGSFDVLKQL